MSIARPLGSRRRWGAGAIVIAALAFGAQVSPAVAASRSWSIVPSPNPPATRATLSSISCSSPTSCFAVGDAFGHGKDRALVEHWDGTAWSVMPTPGITAIGFLNAVSCASVRSCSAVGSRFVGGGGLGQTLAARWDGSSWSQIPTPTPGPGAGLIGVSCVDGSSCVAVGESISASGSERTLIEAWDGTRWSVVASPTPSGGSSALSGVTCLTASSCVSVGEHVPSQQTADTLVERWDGVSWKIVPSPNVASSSTSELAAVACAGTSSCVAVGQYLDAAGSATLAETWNGASWRIVPSANPASGRGSLVGVSCASANDCAAVGIGGTGGAGANASLIEHWQGTSWALVGHPDPKPSKGSALLGVACVFPTACIAVGLNFPTVPTQTTLVEQQSR